MTRATPCLAALLAVALSGCAGRSDYPSLARRPAERVTGSAQPAAPASPSAPAPPVLSDDMGARIDQLVEQARVAHAAFEAKRGAAERAAGGSGTLGSESWASASIALAALDTAHATSLRALSQLDVIEADHRVEVAGADDALSAAVIAARDVVSPLVEAERAVVDWLQTRLGG